MRKRKEYEFIIEGTEFPGKGVAFHEGEKVAIKSALPGQKVRARVTKKNSNGVEAKLLEVLEDVDYKVKPACDIFGVCGGCSQGDLSLDTQLKFKEEQVKALLENYYRILKHEGFLRNLVVRKAINTGEILVNIVTTTQVEYDFTAFVDTLKGLNLKGELTGIIHTLNDSLSDVVQADSVEILHGKDYIIENLLGLKFKINPFAFFQTNTKGAEKLYSIVRDFIGESEDKVVFDLYCGTGTIGQIVAPKAKKVVGIELIEEAVEAAKENAKINGLSNCEFIAGDVAVTIKNVTEKPDIIILDPPRPGVHPVALDYVIKFDAKEIIYVSCNPKTLAVDLGVLTANGYKVEKVKVMDMFPHTPHVEVVTKLTKSKAN